MIDLFTEAEQRYPNAPGHKVDGTSAVSATKMKGKAATLRKRSLEIIDQAGPWGYTADEIAHQLGESVLAVRPRISELKGQGLIRENGVRRPNASGLFANVWVSS